MSQKDPRTYTIIGAMMEVHKHLGRGFLEAVYHEAADMEMSSRTIPFAHEVELPIFYKGTRLKTFYRADFVCFGEIIIELKAISAITDIERAQILNYLKATKMKVGLLINFGAESLEYERFVYWMIVTTDTTDGTDF